MPTQRVALISDIHGNEIALRAVLADIARAGVERIACLGDTAALGPRPHEVLQLLREHCELFILGNHDEYMFAPELISQHTSDPRVVASIHWCRAKLSDAEIAFVRSFEGRRNLTLGAAGELLLFHGSPQSNNCDLTAETPAEELSRELGPERATVMAGGHTHIQMLRQHHAALLVNPGSVGCPFERYVAGTAPTIMPWAEYAIVEANGSNVSVALRRVALDPAELLAMARTWDAPLATYMVDQYERAVTTASE